MDLLHLHMLSSACSSDCIECHNSLGTLGARAEKLRTVYVVQSVVPSLMP